MRVHKQQLPDSPVKPPNQLLSRHSTTDADGVFDFDEVLYREEEEHISVASDADSYYSDAGIVGKSDNESGIDSDDDDDLQRNDDDSDFSDSTYITEESMDVDNNSDSFSYDSDESSTDSVNLPYFTARPFPDEHVPFSKNIFTPPSKINSSAHFTAQLQLSQIFSNSKASLKMHDEVIDIINAYIESLNIEHTNKLMHHSPFLEKLEKSYGTDKFKPTYGSVQLNNGGLATVPVFDMKTMILLQCTSILPWIGMV